MSYLGDITLYGLRITDNSETVTHLTDEHALTRAQVNKLIQTAENTIVDGAPDSYNNLSEIVYVLNTEDTNVSTSLSSNLANLVHDRTSTVASFAGLISDNSAANVNRLHEISVQLSTDVANDFLDDHEVSQQLSTELSRAEAVDTEISNHAHAQMSTHLADDNYNSTEHSSALANQFERNNLISNSLSVSLASHLEPAVSANSTALSTEVVRATNEKNELSTNFSIEQYNGSDHSTVLFQTYSTESTNVSTELFSVSNDISTELVRAQGDTADATTSKIALSTNMSSEVANLESQQTDWSNSINTLQSDNLLNFTNFSDEMSTSLYNVSAEVVAGSVEYWNKENSLSVEQSNNQVFLEDYAKYKAPKLNPVITGSLLVNNDGNELKFGNWSLRAETDGNESNLAFYWHGNGSAQRAIPFMATKATIATVLNEDAAKYIEFDSDSELDAGNKLYYVYPGTSISSEDHVLVESRNVGENRAVVNWQNVNPRQGRYYNADTGVTVDLTFTVNIQESGSTQIGSN